MLAENHRRIPPSCKVAAFFGTQRQMVMTNLVTTTPINECLQSLHATREQHACLSRSSTMARERFVRDQNLLLANNLILVLIETRSKRISTPCNNNGVSAISSPKNTARSGSFANSLRFRRLPVTNCSGWLLAPCCHAWW